jgi:hypothetical protein
LISGRQSAVRPEKVVANEPVTLVRVGNDKGHLGGRRSGQTFVAPHRSKGPGDESHERHPIVIVDPGEVGDLGRTEVRVCGEETEPHRLGRKGFVEGDQGIGVCGADWAEVGLSP